MRGLLALLFLFLGISFAFEEIPNINGAEKMTREIGEKTREDYGDKIVEIYKKKKDGISPYPFVDKNGYFVKDTFANGLIKRVDFGRMLADRFYTHLTRIYDQNGVLECLVLKVGDARFKKTCFYPSNPNSSPKKKSEQFYIEDSNFPLEWKKLDGESVFYYENGKVSKRILYKDQIIQNIKEYDTKGKLISEKEYVNGAWVSEKKSKKNRH